MKIGRKNRVSTNIFDYNIGLIGESGVGKTTVIYEMLHKLLPDDGFLFVEVGKEDGQSAIQDIPYVSAIDWNSDYDEDANTVGFRTFVDDVIDNKTADYPNLKTVVIDTLDELSEIAKQEVIRLHNRQYPEKKVKSIKAAFGGYMAGEDMANDLILDALWDLKKVGVSFIVIGHTKFRDQTDIATGETYSQLTTNMSLRDFNAIKTKLHFLGVAYMDRSIAKENARNGKKRGVIKDESRKIAFRSDDFSIDSKSRFANIVPEIPLNADALIKALQDAIDSAVESNGTSVADQRKLDKQREKNTEEKVAAKEEANNETKQLAALVEKIRRFCVDNKDSNKEAVIKVVKKSKELGYDNPLQVMTIDDAKELLALCA